MSVGSSGWRVVARWAGLGVALATGCSSGAATPDAAVDVAVTTDGGAAPEDAGATDAGAGPVDAGESDAFVNTQAQTFTHQMGPWMVAAGGEQSSSCESWTLNNAEPLYLNSVEMTATAGMHHSNWFFVPDSNFPGPDGTWPCAQRNFDQGVASFLGGVFFAQSTQVTHETQQFPPGTAVVIPPHARIIGQLHMLNASASARAISLGLTVRTLARADVQTRLSPFYLEYHPLDLAPRSRSQFQVECAVDERAQMLTGMPFSMRFFYGLAHYHELGTRMQVQVIGGAADGRTLYETDARQGESWARTMSPPVDVSGARALRLTCSFDNTRSTRVRYGLGSGEMCIWFGFTDSAYQWAGRATASAASMATSEVRDGVTYSTAPCNELFTTATRNRME